MNQVRTKPISIIGTAHQKTAWAATSTEPAIPSATAGGRSRIAAGLFSSWVTSPPPASASAP
jgi:hypothetical protein